MSVSEAVTLLVLPSFLPWTQLPCGSTGTYSGNRQDKETCMARACHTSRQPLQNHPSGYLGGWATKWLAEKQCWMDNINEWTSLSMPELLTRASCRKDSQKVASGYLMQVPHMKKIAKHRSSSRLQNCPLTAAGITPFGFDYADLVNASNTEGDPLSSDVSLWRGKYVAMISSWCPSGCASGGAKALSKTLTHHSVLRISGNVRPPGRWPSSIVSFS